MILKIKNKKFDFFNGFQLSLRYDSIASTFSFNSYFDPNNPEHKELFKPGSYNKCTLEHNGELLITGYVISNGFNSSPVKELVSIGGYSSAGILEDCEIPTSLYPLQSDGRTLKEITERLIKPFGVKLISDSALSAAINKPYETSTAKESQSIKSYISELAAQKNIIVSHDVNGNILFTRAQTNKVPVFELTSGIPGTKMALSFDGQQMHSSITVQKQADSDGGNAGESTVSNPYASIFRPRVISQSSGDDNDTAQAARNALSAELKNIKLTITTDRWEIGGKIIKPNNIISVTNPELYLYKKSKWFIESIDFSGDNTKTTAVINCVLPEVYNNQTPKNIFT
jgi:prophage tail gpP-like protein